MNKYWHYCCGLSLSLLLYSVPLAQATEATNQLLEEYAASSTTAFSAKRGESMWTEQHMQKKLQKPVSCATCHGSNLYKSGEHIRTGKLIEPMARAVNQARLTDVKKIRKWLRRNCRWTLGRECIAQEKGDVLQYLLTKEQ